MIKVFRCSYGGVMFLSTANICLNLTGGDQSEKTFWLYVDLLIPKCLLYLIQPEFPQKPINPLKNSPL